jgi:thymidine kinase
MAKLYFRYSAMDAGKTLDLIKVAFNYKDRGQDTLILTSAIDKRAGMNNIKSRIGLNLDAISTTHTDNLFNLIKDKISHNKTACVLIDEIHFFSVEQINQLSDVVDYLKIPVICYGLRTDYRGEPFLASARLLAIADSLEELKTICHCGRKATYNMLIKNGTAVKEGSVVVVDDDSLKANDTRYMSVCRRHWKEGQYQ